MAEELVSKATGGVSKLAGETGVVTRVRLCPETSQGLLRDIDSPRARVKGQSQNPAIESGREETHQGARN